MALDLNKISSNDFFISFNSEENTYYHTGNQNSQNTTISEDGRIILTSKKAAVRIERRVVNPSKSGAILQKTTVETVGKEPLKIDVISAAFLTDIGKNGSKPWKKHRFLLHFAYSCWQGEAQWRHVFAEDAGLYRTYNHGTQSTFRLASKSTWSTCQFEPLLIVEDTEAAESYYVQLHCGHGWMIEAGIRGYRDDIGLCILGTDCFDRNDGWHVTLDQGETVTTCPALIGSVSGGFEEAVRELTMANRSLMRA